MYMDMYMCMDMHMHMYMDMDMCMCMYMCMYKYMCMCMCMYMLLRTYMRMCMHLRIDRPREGAVREDAGEGVVEAGRQVARGVLEEVRLLLAVESVAALSPEGEGRPGGA